MTRKARCGNTQKHVKMPGDATPWEELSQGIKKNAGPKRSHTEKKTTVDGIVTTEPIANTTAECIVKTEPIANTMAECIVKTRPIEKTNLENVLKAEPIAQTTVESIVKTEPIAKTKVKSFEKNTDELSAEIEKVNHIEDPTSEVNQETKTPAQRSFEEKRAYKKKMALERLKQRRLENGVTLLSQKQERKIYLIKKKLRQKGMPPEAIRDIIRKKRRAEEIQFRKTFTTKTCFNCRKQGHLLSDCPEPLGPTNQATGVCFKCGSTEHVSYRCPKKVSGYPLAKCFICKEQGHISKECPKNNNGVYIKGGSCNVCGNVNHLQKDCPTLKKKKEERIIPAYTINQGRSIDDEIVEGSTTSRKKMKKQPKIVKF